MTIRQTNPPQESDDEEQQQQQQEQQEQQLERAPLEYDQELETFISQEKLENSQYLATLYRIDKWNRGKKYIIDHTPGSIMTADEVGLRFGSGSYYYLVSYPRRDGKQGSHLKRFTFHVGEEYDAKRKAMGVVKDVPNDPKMTTQPQVIMQQQPQVDPFDQLTKLMSIILPLIQANKPTVDPGVMLLQQHQMMSDVLKKNLIEQVSMNRQVLEASLPQPEYDDDKEDDVPQQPAGPTDLISQILPLVEEWLPRLLGGGLESKIAAEGLKRLPQFKNVVKNKDELALLITELDKTAGAENVNKLLTKLKIARPGATVVAASAPKAKK